jgi:hypothetical protein
MITAVVERIRQHAEINYSANQHQSACIPCITRVRIWLLYLYLAEIVFVANIAAKQMVVRLDLTLRAQRPLAIETFSFCNAGWVLKTKPGLSHICVLASMRR